MAEFTSDIPLIHLYIYRYFVNTIEMLPEFPGSFIIAKKRGKSSTHLRN